MANRARNPAKPGCETSTIATPGSVAAVAPVFPAGSWRLVYRAAALALAFTLSVLAASSLPQQLPGSLGDLSDAASAQVTPLDDEPPDEAPGLGRITGSPDPGPAPEDPGDRGGAAQLALAVILIAAVGFIGRQIMRDVRRGRAGPDTQERTG